MPDILQPKNSLKVYKGETKTLKLKVTNSDGTPKNLTGGRLVMTVKRTTADTTPVLQKTTDSSSQALLTNATGGEAEFYLVPADTKNLTAREYVFDLWLVQSGKSLLIIPPTIFDLNNAVTTL